VSGRGEGGPGGARATQRGRGRLSSLDGLRGVAALVVLLHHSLLAIPALAAPYYVRRAVDTDEIATWAMTHTPLHLVWAGTEAVYVFFVLSGLVLALSAQGRRFTWLSYYPQRLLRLYLPVIAAVALGMVILILVPRDGTSGISVWLRSRPRQITQLGLIHDLTLVQGVSGLVSPLWSLRWEVLFSLALPLYVLLVARVPSLWVLKSVAVVAATTAGAVLHHDWLVYLPMFGAGVIIAARLDRLTAWVTSLSRGGTASLVVGTVLLLSSHWLMLAFSPPAEVMVLSKPLGLVGAAGIVLVVAAVPAARTVFSAPLWRWLGLYSFSLYLVHEPIVVALGYLVGPGRGWLVLPIALPLSLCAAWAFYHAVEKPSHDLSRRAARLGGVLSARLGRAPAAPQAHGAPAGTAAQEAEAPEPRGTGR
jgi:peptidoglycan/LPS O-acetylase OafA/YrhL